MSNVTKVLELVNGAARTIDLTTNPLESLAFITASANPASAGIVRLSNNEGIKWRNFANGADVTLLVNTSDLFSFSSGATFTGSVSASNISGTNTGDQTITLTGDVTGSGTGSFATTLATVNANVGTFGSSTSIPTFTVNAKGLITAASGNVVIAPAGTLTGTTLAANVVTSSLTSFGASPTLSNPIIGNIVDVSNVLNIKDSGDQTKIIAINASGNSTSTTLTLASTSTSSRTLSFPNITGADTVAVLSLAQVLLNKTFTDNVTLFQNTSDTSRKMKFDLTNITSATTRTLTVPDTSDTLAVLGLAQTFSGATIFSAAGTALTVNNNATIGGTLGILSAATINAQLSINGTSTLTATTQRAMDATFTASSAATLQITGVRIATTTGAAVTNVDHFRSSTLTTTGGAATRFVEFAGLGAAAHPATNNATFSDSNSFTGNYFIVQSGTDPSVLTGALGIGGASATNSGLQISGSPFSGASQFGVNSNITTTSSATNVRSYRASVAVSAATAITAMYNYYAGGINSLGGGSSVTNYIDFYSAGAANHTSSNNAGLADNDTFTGNYFLNQSGTDPSTLTGNLTVNGTGDNQIGGTAGRLGVGIAAADTLTVGHGTNATDVTFGLRAKKSTGSSLRTVFTQSSTDGSLTVNSDVGGNGTGGFSFAVQGTNALTIDSSRNATFAGNANTIGTTADPGSAKTTLAIQGSTTGYSNAIGLLVKAGSAANNYTAIFNNAANNLSFLTIGGTGVVATKNNTLDDASGNATFAGTILTGGTITIPNNTALQWKDSGGTARRVAVTSGINDNFFGPVDAGWGAITRVRAGTTLELAVNGSSGAFTTAQTIDTSGNATFAGSVYFTTSTANVLRGTSTVGDLTDSSNASVGSGVLGAIASTSAAASFKRNGGDGSVVTFARGGAGIVGSISVTSSATAFNTSSDRRLKNNIVDAPSAIDTLNSIKIRSFDWKANGEHQKFGVIAQELEPVAPEAVTAPDKEGDMYTVDYSKLVPRLIKAIQELKAEFDAYKASHP